MTYTITPALARSLRSNVDAIAATLERAGYRLTRYPSGAVSAASPAERPGNDWPE